MSNTGDDEGLKDIVVSLLYKELVRVRAQLVESKVSLSFQSIWFFSESWTWSGARARHGVRKRYV